MIPERQRIEQVITFLIYAGKVKNDTDFAHKLDYDKSSLSKMRLGKRAVTNELKQRIHDIFRIPRAYLFDGKGEIKIEEPTTENELVKSKALIESLRGTIKAQKETIRAQALAIKSLQRQLEPQLKVEAKDTVKAKKVNKDK